SIDNATPMVAASLAGCDRPDRSLPVRDCIVRFTQIWGPIVTWINGAANGSAPRHDISLLQLNSSSQVVAAVELSGAPTKTVDFDALDGASGVAWGMTLVLHPGSAATVTPSGGTVTVAGGGVNQIASNFRVSLNGSALTGISKVLGLEL